jgi:hypothetical protein
MLWERKQIEEALALAREEAARRKSEAHYRDLVENAAYGIYRASVHRVRCISKVCQFLSLHSGAWSDSLSRAST